ncbi:hypothetical protein BTI679_30830 [Bacillus wiedmannii]|nr:hypothetical protein BTI679_30830 [Bacillus wiedmannii]
MILKIKYTVGLQGDFEIGDVFKLIELGNDFATCKNIRTNRECYIAKWRLEVIDW